MTDMIYLTHDDVFLDHATGRHPETADRLRAIAEELQKRDLLTSCERLPVKAIAETDVLRLHAAEQIQRVKETAESGGGALDVDTVVSEESFKVGLTAAGACAASVDAVMKGKIKTALNLVRPPGHHATAERSMGFCLFNNIALAADRARAKHELNRILIVDWDVHHGNGTQDIFYADPSVTFMSIHRYGSGFYPGTGSADETGTGKGLGTTINVPLRSNTARATYVDAFRSNVEAVADRCKPELVLLSAGFDAHRLDPVGGLGLEADDFVTLTDIVKDVAKTHCAGRLISCLEGGYHWQATAESVALHLETLSNGKQ